MTTDGSCPISCLFPGPKGAKSRAAPCWVCCGCGTRGAAPPSPCCGHQGAGKGSAEGQGSVSIFPVAVRSCNSRGGCRRLAQVSHSHSPPLPCSVCRCLLTAIPCSPCVGDSSPMSLWDMELPGIGRRTGLGVFGSFGPQQWHITGELHAPSHAQLSSLTRHIHIPGAKSLCGAAKAGASTTPHPLGHQRDEPRHMQTEQQPEGPPLPAAGKFCLLLFFQGLQSLFACCKVGRALWHCWVLVGELLASQGAPRVILGRSFPAPITQSAGLWAKQSGGKQRLFPTVNSWLVQWGNAWC